MKYLIPNFKIGQRYNYDDLPKVTQNEIDVQFEDEYDESVDDYQWEFKYLQPEDIEEYLDNIYGYNIGDALDDPYMKKIIRNIKKNGIMQPAVGFEGNHRALACWHLKIPLPYLEPIKKQYQNNESHRIMANF